MGQTSVTFPFLKGVDPISGIEEYELSFFLKYYLPTHRISELQERTYYDSVTNTLEEYEQELKLKEPEGNFANVIASGSAAEGLLLPVFFNRITERKIFHSDFDILRILPGVVASDIDYDGPDICHPMEAASHPGFVRLELTVEGVKVGYVNNREITKIAQDMALKFPIPDLHMTGHGPAVTSESPKLPIEIDNVYSIKCYTWPKSASEWKTRQRLSNWPSPSMVEHIVSDGCLVVPVGHRLSPEPDFEWRISFSKAEKALAQSLTVFQKKAYMLLKILHREYFSSPKVIATYHVKTILFWVCEREPESFWSDSNMARCLFALLDELITCLTSHILPNFFIPENNMISHIQSDLVKAILEKVLTARKDPFEAILSFDQTYRLVRGPRKPWKSSIDYLRNTVKKAKSDSEVISCFEYTLLGVSNLMVAQSGDVEWGSREALYFLKEAWGYQTFVCQSNNTDPGQFIQYVWYHLAEMFQHMSGMPTKVTMQRLGSMVEYSIMNCEITSDDTLYSSLLHSFAGTLYHAIAYWAPEFDFHPGSRSMSDKEREEAKTKSEIFHKKAVELSPDDFRFKTEYAKLLFHKGAFQEVVNILEPLVHLQISSVIQEKTIITRAELPTLEVKLQTISSAQLNIPGRPVTIPDVVIGLYYLVMAKMKAGYEKDTLCGPMKQLKLACEHQSNQNPMFSSKMYKILTELQAEKHD